MRCKFSFMSMMAICILVQSGYCKDLTTTSFLDAATGRQIHAVGLPGTNTCHLYFNAQTWNADSTKLILCTNIQTNKNCDFVEFDTVSGTTTYLDSSRYYHGVVSPTNKFCYTKANEIYSIDLNTHDKTLLYTMPDNKPLYGVPSVSNDGTIMTVYWRDTENRPRNISKINTVTKAFSTIIVSAYVKSVFGNDSIDHPMVNPVHHSLFFYCRNGRNLSDRLWVYDESLNKHKNLYIQKFIGEQLGEYVGHEMWAYNGEKLYFVKYVQSPLTPAGLMWVDKWDSNQYGYINSDYPYLHAAVSPDEKWMVADTRYTTGTVAKESNVVLVDMKTKKSELLAKVNTWAAQPGHVHPSFSPDNKKVVFTFADKNNNLWVGYIDISETPNPKGEKCPEEKTMDP